MEKLRNLLFYGGAMPDVYRNCRDEIRKENLEKLFFFLTVEIVFLLIALAVCCAVKSLAGGFIAYIIALACALVLLCTVQSCQKDTRNPYGAEAKYQVVHLCGQFYGHLLSAEPLSGLLCLPG